MMDTKHRILIVDDSEMNREILLDMLGDEYDIYQAQDGEQAIAVLTTQGSMFSLVLLDIFMPKKDGFDVLTAMRYDLKLIDYVPVIMISSESSPESMEHAYRLGATDYITRPFNEAIVKRRVTNTIKLYAKQKNLIEIVGEQVGEKEKNSEMLINILSHIVEFRNGESGLHVLHVRRITEILLEALSQKSDKYNLSMSDRMMIANASALHDIGKITIPDSILNKPGRLTPEEFEIMKTHSAAGGNLVKQVRIYSEEPLVHAVYEICRWHHERFDGRGYPDGLKGDEIPISAQVVAIADVYDALTSERCYKAAFSHEKALAMIMNNECGVFNPLILECLNESAEIIRTELAKGDAAYNNDGQEAVQITQEILRRKDLSSPETAASIIAYERAKNEFFTAVATDVLFEYIKATDTLIISDSGVQKLGIDKIIINPLTNEKLFSAVGKDVLTMMVESVNATTPEQPTGRFDVSVKGIMRRVVFQTVRATGDASEIIGFYGKSIDL